MATLLNQSMPPIPITADLLIQGGAVFVLGVVALMIFLGWLIPKATYKQLERDRDFWREAAMKAIGHTDTLLPGAQIAVEVTRELGRQVGTTQSSVERAVERALGGAPPETTS